MSLPMTYFRGTRLPEVTTIACDAYSTLFSKAQLSPQDDVYMVLASHGFDVNMFGGDQANDQTVWRAYQKYETLDYRGEIHGPQRWILMLADLGIKDAAFSWELVLELQAAEFDCYRRHARLFPGALDFIVAANGVGLTTVLFTSATETGWLLEQLMLLPPLFTKKVVSCFEGVVKRPSKSRDETDMDTLQGRLISRLRCTPARTLVIDDNKGYLKIAKGLGFRTCLNLQGEARGAYDPKADYNQHIDLVVDGLLGIKQWLPVFDE